MRSNPRSKVVESSLDELRENRRVFKKMFVCLFNCMQKGLGIWFRLIICLDGCFLKT